MEENNRRTVCVTGATGFVGSWLLKTLLDNGYCVNTTIRTHPDKNRNISYLKNLSGSSERLKIFYADLDKPDTFAPAIKGCVGVFHVAHPMEWDEKETEETKTKRVIDGLLVILQASLDSKTVKRFVYTSSSTAVTFNSQDSDIKDEESWTDVDFMRSLGLYGASYVITKTLAEKTALEFGEKHGLEVVTVVPTLINGPFFGDCCPNSVRLSLALVFGDEEYYKYLVRTSLVHVDDVARAHVHLFQYTGAKGRYICSAAGVSIDELSEFLSTRYPEYNIPKPDCLKGMEPVEICGLSSRKLLETGFEYHYGLQEMFDGAIRSCKEKGLL